MLIPRDIISVQHITEKPSEHPVLAGVKTRVSPGQSIIEFSDGKVAVVDTATFWLFYDEVEDSSWMDKVTSPFTGNRG